MACTQFFIKYNRTVTITLEEEIPPNANFRYLSLLYFKRTSDPIGLCHFIEGGRVIPLDDDVRNYPELRHKTFHVKMNGRQPSFMNAAAADRNYLTHVAFMEKWWPILNEYALSSTVPQVPQVPITPPPTLMSEMSPPSLIRETPPPILMSGTPPLTSLDDWEGVSWADLVDDEPNDISIIPTILFPPDNDERTLVSGEAGRLLIELSQKSGQSLDCPICLTNITTDLCITRCGHIYHAQCLSNWSHDSCPKCRESLL